MASDASSYQPPQTYPVYPPYYVQQQPRPESAPPWAIALIILVVVIVIAGAIWVVGFSGSDDSGSHWDIRNLHYHDFDYDTIEVDGVIVNLKGDAESVEVRCYAKTQYGKFYGTAYVGDIPAGGSDTFWCLITYSGTCGYYGVDEITWYNA